MSVEALIASARAASIAAGEPFRVVCADPPWRFGDKLPGAGRGAERQYPTLTAKQICQLPLPAIADNAILFLWRVGSMQQEALDVMRAWRFDQKSEIVWNKLTKNGKPFFGMGRTVRGAHETCLIGWRGRPEILDKGIRSVFDAPVPTYPEGHPDIGKAKLDPKTGAPLFHKRTGKPLVVEVGDYIHSAKPERFYTEVVERLAGGPYVEIFSRRTREGWHMIGNEVGKYDA